MKYSLRYIEKIFSEMANDSLPLSEWDDFVSLTAEDSLSKYWQNRARDIETQFSNPSNGILISDDGVNELKRALNEIQMLRRTTSG